MYAGVRNGSMCMCGDTFGRYGRAPDESCCDTSCTGNVSQTCGGPYATQIVHTSIGMKWVNVMCVKSQWKINYTFDAAMLRLGDDGDARRRNANGHVRWVLGLALNITSEEQQLWVSGGRLAT